MESDSLIPLWGSAYCSGGHTPSRSGAVLWWYRQVLQFCLAQLGAVLTVNRPTEALAAFIKLVEGDSDLQGRVKTAEAPQAIADIAASHGYEISCQELRAWSRDLTAHYFPWSTMGHEWRRNFFKNEK